VMLVTFVKRSASKWLVTAQLMARAVSRPLALRDRLWQC
jgi:hypothetical protein